MVMCITERSGSYGRDKLEIQADLHHIQSQLNCFSELLRWVEPTELTSLHGLAVSLSKLGVELAKIEKELDQL